jgi:hypothetical protein
MPHIPVQSPCFQNAPYFFSPKYAHSAQAKEIFADACPHQDDPGYARDKKEQVFKYRELP